MSMIVEIALGQMIKCNKIEQWTVELWAECMEASNQTYHQVPMVGIFIIVLGSLDNRWPQQNYNLIDNNHDSTFFGFVLTFMNT